MKNQERKVNPPILKHTYRYFVCYSRNGKVILTYEDGGYYLGGRLPYNTDLLKVEQLDDLAAQWVLRVVESLKFNKKKNEKNKEYGIVSQGVLIYRSKDLLEVKKMVVEGNEKYWEDYQKAINAGENPADNQLFLVELDSDDEKN